MKNTDKKQPVNTIPKGVWESSRPNQKEDKSEHPDAAVDLQGNGYPARKQSK